MAHRLLPRPKEGGWRTLRAPGIVAAYGGTGDAVRADHLIPYGTGKREQVVIPPCIRVQPRQEQPPHSPVLEGCALLCESLRALRPENQTGTSSAGAFYAGPERLVNLIVREPLHLEGKARIGPICGSGSRRDL